MKRKNNNLDNNDGSKSSSTSSVSLVLPSSPLLINKINRTEINNNNNNNTNQHIEFIIEYNQEIDRLKETLENANSGNTKLKDYKDIHYKSIKEIMNFIKKYKQEFFNNKNNNNYQELKRIRKLLDDIKFLETGEPYKEIMVILFSILNSLKEQFIEINSLEDLKSNKTFDQLSNIDGYLKINRKLIIQIMGANTPAEIFGIDNTDDESSRQEIIKIYNQYKIILNPRFLTNQIPRNKLKEAYEILINNNFQNILYFNINV